jgi:hypothetical protein
MTVHLFSTNHSKILKIVHTFIHYEIYIIYTNSLFKF